MKVAFALDPRIELLAAVIMLARPETPARGPYEERMRAHHSPLARQPAVAALARLLAAGVPEPVFAELLLSQPDARKLSLDPARSAGPLTRTGRAEEIAAFFELLGGFARLAGWEGFFRSCRSHHAGFIALARAESAKSPSPALVSAYLRMPFPRPCRMILSPLLPRAFAANVALDRSELRLRNGSFDRGRLTFEYDAIECCVAHELTHTVLAPLIGSSREVFERYPGAPSKACRDASSWSGCVEEHLVRAITMRAVKLSGDETLYRATLRRWSRSGYPYLKAFCGALEGFERSPSSRDFAAFYPGLVAAFRA